MNDIDQVDRGWSLHMFRRFVESQCNKHTDPDYIEEQTKMLRKTGIDPNLSKKQVEEIRMKCKCLGESGWVLSPFWKPGENETWYDTWFWKAYHGSSESITEYFLRDNCSLLNNINGYTRFEVDRTDWFTEAETLFKMEHYTSCALLLTVILERNIRKCLIDSWRYKVTVFFEESVKTRVEDYYINKSIEPLSRYIETVLLMPSLDAFICRYFKGNYKFEDGKEPGFLERNWLMHGQMEKDVTQSDCIQLFNVICTFHYVLHTVSGTDYGQ